MLTPKAARELRKIGYKPTVENLKTFQAARGIKATGTLTPATSKALAAVAQVAEKNPHFLVAGMKNFDVWKMEADFKKLGVNPGKHDGVMDDALLDKIQAFKKKHPELHNVGRYAGGPMQRALHRAATEPKVIHPTHTKYLYPAGKVGNIIGRPFQGTHTRGNWESDRAVDISLPVGTPLYAAADGVIGSQIGPLSSSDPHLLGQRLHLEVPGNEFYYAHLSKLAVHAGQHVKKGQIIGWSGSAAGVPHLHIASKVGSPEHWFNV